MQDPTATTFKDGAPQWTYSVGNTMDATFSCADTTDTVQSFMQRQQRIATYQWEVGQPFFETFNPWQLFFQNKRVLNRLANFKLLRARLNVKIVINGNAFYYGRLIASYLPLHTVDRTTRMRIGNRADFVEASQRPHVYLDPSAALGGDMELPFFFHKNAMEIPKADWSRMGTITIADLNTLANANDNDAPLTITVFAYATDVNISQPTSAQPPLEEQADEYDGPISKPATVIGNIASRLSLVPGIAPYARATQMVAKTTADVANFFGYSKERDMETTTVECVAAHDANVYNTKTRAVSMALDSKKEVTIDPRTVGLQPKDEMVLTDLAKRESYLTTFVWEQDQPVDSFLFNSHVHPTIARISDDEVHMPPSAWVATPFRYWHGSMEFRFQVVASGFHKGRLRIVWDPDFQASAEYNLNYQEVIDISTDKDFVFKVGWGQATSYLPVITPGSQESYSADTVFNTRVGNGVLSVFVVTELAVPGPDLAPVEINVFTRMCDDFEVAEPTQTHFSDIRMLPPIPAGPVYPTLEMPGALAISTEAVRFVEPASAIQDGEIRFLSSAIGAQDFEFTIPYFVDLDGADENNVLIQLRVSVATPQNLTLSFSGGTELFSLGAGVTLVTGVFPIQESLLQPGLNSLLFNISLPFYDGTTDFVDLRNFTTVVEPGMEWRFVSLTTDPQVTSTATIGAYNGSPCFNFSPGEQITYSPPNGFDLAPWNCTFGAAGAFSVFEDLDSTSYQIPFSDNIHWTYFGIPRIDPVVSLTSTSVVTFSSLGAAFVLLAREQVPQSACYNRPNIIVPNWFLANNWPETFDYRVFATHRGDIMQDVVNRAKLFDYLIDDILVHWLDFCEYYDLDLDVSDDIFQNLVFYTQLEDTPQIDFAQSGEMPTVDTDLNASAPMGGSPDQQMGPTVVGAQNLVFFGEAISSWRVLLRRAVKWYKAESAQSVALPALPINSSRMLTDPLHRIYLTPIEWVCSAYVASRGGLRQSLIPENGTSASMRAVRGDGAFPGYENSDPVAAPFYRAQGSAYMNNNSYSELTYEVPWYNQFRFYPNRYGDAVYDPELGLDPMWHRFQSTDDPMICVSAAEDFTCFFFLCTPIITLV